MKKLKAALFTLLVALMLFAGLAVSSSAASEVASVTVLKASQTETAITLSWNKTANALGYRVFERVGTSWKALKTTASTSYTVTSLASATKHTYAVRAYNRIGGKVVWSDAIKTVITATRPEKPSYLKANVAEKEIKLTWPAVKRATGYRIFQYNPTTKKWDIALKATAATTATIKNLTPGKNYIFAVRPYVNTGVEIIWSTTYTQQLTSTLPSAPVMKAQEVRSNSVTLTWNKVSGANGYRVLQYDPSTKQWKVIVSATTALSTTVENLQSAKTYIFTVRAYKKLNNGYLYSTYKNFSVQTLPDYSAVTLGLICLHDENSIYDMYFIESMKAAAQELGFSTIIKINIPESNDCYTAAKALAKQGCDVIVANSFGHEDFMLKVAKEYPNVDFCTVSGNKAKSSGVANYHNAYVKSYEGRYLSGIAAGYKLNEMIKNKQITSSQAKIGYVATYPYFAEVISDYTAFYLGAKSVCPTVKMQVKFTNSHMDIYEEAEATEQLIYDDCVIISQHSTSGVSAVVCDEYGVYCIPHAVDLSDYYPETFLISSAPMWSAYFIEAATYCAMGADIPTDWAKGVADYAVMISDLGDNAASGTATAISAAAQKIANGEIKVFDTSKFTVNSKRITSYKADVIPDNSFTPDTQVIYNGAFLESDAERFRSAPYFDLLIDGITLDY